ncbi:MAG TPA: hypothetical protein VN861_16420 [Candidatus Acidoferrales bacterium]|nr:hypothetical protein [Candidatus Acidoferrales bacterium]
MRLDVDRDDALVAMARVVAGTWHAVAEDDGRELWWRVCDEVR